MPALACQECSRQPAAAGVCSQATRFSWRWLCSWEMAATTSSRSALLQSSCAQPRGSRPHTQPILQVSYVSITGMIKHIKEQRAIKAGKDIHIDGTSSSMAAMGMRAHTCPAADATLPQSARAASRCPLGWACSTPWRLRRSASCARRCSCPRASPGEPLCPALHRAHVLSCNQRRSGLAHSLHAAFGTQHQHAPHAQMAEATTPGRSGLLYWGKHDMRGPSAEAALAAGICLRPAT